MRVALYARCSMDDKGGEREQNPELQLQPLREECRRCRDEVVGEFVDMESGGSFLRQKFIELIELCKTGKIELIRVWKIDRFTRQEPIEGLIVIYELGKLGVCVKSLTEPSCDTTPTRPVQNRGMMWIMICIALYIGYEEREKIKERTRAGIAAKKADGVWKGGRPKGKKDSTQRVRRFRKIEKVNEVNKLFSIEEKPQEKTTPPPSDDTWG